MRYVIVSAVRIQRWIARTPDLRLTRGASVALGVLSAPDQVLAGLASDLPGSGVSWADDAGDVAGVVAVVVPDRTDPQAVRKTVVRRLHRDLPGLEWVSWSGDAPDYVTARAASIRAGIGSDAHLRVPSVGGVPFAPSCQGCGSEPAHADKPAPGGTGRRLLGRDCLCRDEWGHPGAIKAHNDRTLGLPGEPPPTFEDLAKVAGSDTATAHSYRGKRNHLATIAADGNGVGALFTAIEQQPGLVSRAAAALDSAAKGAVTAAVQLITGTSRTTPAIVHYVGGDDVLVSVPAPLAWRFVIELAGGFNLGQVFADGGITVDDGLGTLIDRTRLGIGMVFAHASHPFADTQTLAHAAMIQAKKAVRGATAAVSWLDLTAEDSIPPGRHREVDDLRDLSNGGGHELDRELIALPSAARSVMSGLVLDARRATSGVRPVDPPPAAARQATERLVRQAERNERTALADLLRHRLLDAAGPSGQLAGELSAIADTLSLARWWPTRDAVPTAAGSGR